MINFILMVNKQGQTRLVIDVKLKIFRLAQYF